MKILVLNCGSSSIKYKLYCMDDKSVLAAGNIEKIGSAGSFMKTKSPVQEKIMADIPSHEEGLKFILDNLTDKNKGAIKTLKEVDAVAQRITVGVIFSKSMLLTPEAVEEWSKYISLGPVHSPAQLKCIKAVGKYLAGIPQVAIFDTGFHQTIPEYAYLYPLPLELSKKYNVRRFGFHGTSFRYVLQRSAEVLNFDPKDKRIIIAHIGNGVSLSAIKDGKCLDTTMGLMPNEGPMMGTRTGDLDPSTLLYVMEQEHLDTKQATKLINNESGLIGISGLTNDMRELVEAAEKGNERAQLAFKMYTYRLKKYIGAFAAILGGLDYLIFTAGVGENQPPVRKGCVEGLEFLGIDIDIEKNEKIYGQETVISKPGSRVTVAVIPTDEELMMAKDCQRIISEQK